VHFFETAVFKKDFNNTATTHMIYKCNTWHKILYAESWANQVLFPHNHIRPFKDLEDMHRQLIINFNKQVPTDGVTYFLGDIVTHSTTLAKEVISQLNGTKILLVGNHDKAYEACYNAGFDVVANNMTIFIAQQKVTLSHCPLLGIFRENTDGMGGFVPGENWHGEERNKRFSVENTGQFHLHGHIHSPNGGKSEKILGRQFDVGLPANKYRPVHISAIESWIAKELK